MSIRVDSRAARALPPFISLIRVEIERLLLPFFALLGLSITLCLLLAPEVGAHETVTVIHLFVTGAAALLFGALCAAGSSEEANVELLLSRGFTRSTIWIGTTLAGLIAVTAFLFSLWAFAPFFAASTSGHDDSHWAWRLYMIGAIYLTHATAAAAAGFTRSSTAAVLIAIGIAGVIELAMVAMGSINPWSVDNELARTLLIDARSWILPALTLIAYALSWRTMVTLGDPPRVRRLGGWVFIAIAVALLSGIVWFIDEVTMTSSEWAQQIAREPRNTWNTHLMPRTRAVPALRRELARVKKPISDLDIIEISQSRQGLPLQAALYDYGENDAHLELQLRWKQRSDSPGGFWPYPDDELSCLLSIDPDSLEESTKDDVFEYATKTLEVISFDRIEFGPLMQYTIALDRKRAKAIWKKMIQSSLESHMPSQQLAVSLYFVVRQWYGDWRDAEELRELLDDDIVDEAIKRWREVDARDWNLARLLAASGREDALAALASDWSRLAGHFTSGWGMRGQPFAGIRDTILLQAAAKQIELLLQAAPGAQLEFSQAERAGMNVAIVILLEHGDRRGLVAFRNLYPGDAAKAQVFMPNTPMTETTWLYPIELLKMDSVPALELAEELLRADGRASFAYLADVASIRRKNEAVMTRALTRFRDSERGGGIPESHASENGGWWWDGFILDAPAGLVLEAAALTTRADVRAAAAELLASGRTPTSHVFTLAHAGMKETIPALIDILDGVPQHSMPSIQGQANDIHHAAHELERLTGQSFGTDSAAWRIWLRESR